MSINVFCAAFREFQNFRISNLDLRLCGTLNCFIETNLLHLKTMGGLGRRMKSFGGVNIGADGIISNPIGVEWVGDVFEGGPASVGSEVRSVFAPEATTNSSIVRATKSTAIETISVAGCSKRKWTGCSYLIAMRNFEGDSAKRGGESGHCQIYAIFQ